jgi:hypothetical protein
MATRAEISTAGIREFRDELSADPLDSEARVAITRHGQAVSHSYPARRRPTAEQLREFDESARAMQEMLDAKGLTEDELMRDIEELRAKSRRQVLNVPVRAARYSPSVS